jgi:hypothetical protein
MSILNHFGKVKTTFTPYKNKHSYADNTSQSEIKHTFGATNVAIQTQFALSANGSPTLLWLKGKQQSPHDALGPGTQSAIQYMAKFIEDQNAQIHNAKYTGIQDFSNVIEKLVTDITSSVWKTVNINPVLTLSQLLCLKVDDVDNRVDHLEKMLKQVIDDNKLLQRKIDALEQQKHIKDLRVARSIRVLIHELD